MSALETVLTRAMNDPDFADLLFEDAGKAVTDYDLTAQEIASLKAMTRLDFEKYSAVAPEERKSLSTHTMISNLTKMKSQTTKNSIANIR